jgi:hypothetical protein
MPANYVLLEKITVGAAGASSVTFSGIPQTGYTDLAVAMSARGSGAYNVDNVKLTANSITSYGNMMLYISGTSPASFSAAAQTTDNLSYTSSGNNTANTFGSMSFYIPNYTSSNYKSVSKDFVAENNSATVFNLGLSATTINSTAAITSLTLAPQSSSTWAQYSTFYLYGVAALGTTPAIVPYATGGDTIMTDGTYWYHAFLASGTFTPATGKSLSCDVVVVAGGGGGGGGSPGYTGGGGGGAGGARALSALSVSSATTVTVGAGGTGGASAVSNATAGSNSIFSSLTSTGGGYGANYGNVGNNGGSGGGGSTDGTSTFAGGISSPVTSPVQGFAGGSALPSGNPFSGGGGGGAGAVGTTGNNTAMGNGGAGLNTWSSYLSTTGLGVSGYIAGGGGGGGDRANPATGGTGGSGGGGNGNNNSAGVAGTANTGGGGGGGARTITVAMPGGNGGSGLVIVRYAV